jgi:hypothetical protein
MAPTTSPEPTQHGIPQLEGFSQLAEELQRWEPQFVLNRLSQEERLYDQDGTLYAVCLSETATLVTDRRREPLGLGDLVVVPQSIAVDVVPEGSFLTLSASGTPPYHFRERFIQIQGFERLSLGMSTCGTLVDDAARHRISYQIVRAGPLNLIDVPNSPWERLLCIALDGDLKVESDQAEQLIELTRGDVFWINSENPNRIIGNGRLGLILLTTETRHEVRKLAAIAASSQALSPESQTKRFQ